MAAVWNVAQACPSNVAHPAAWMWSARTTHQSGQNPYARTAPERIFDIRRQEWPTALGLSFFFFLVIAVFWVLKPIKRGALIGFYADDPRLNAMALRAKGMPLSAEQQAALDELRGAAANLVERAEASSAV